MNWVNRLFGELEPLLNSYLSGEYTDEETGEPKRWDGKFSDLSDAPEPEKELVPVARVNGIGAYPPQTH